MIFIKNNIIYIAIICILSWNCSNAQNSKKFDFTEYFAASDSGVIYPSLKQIKILNSIVPKSIYKPSPSISNRKFWNKIANTTYGKQYFKESLALIDNKPQIPITDETYRLANKTGRRGLYKPRYYFTMDCLEHFILAECIENKGRFLPKIEAFCDSIMAMKSWMHPNHDDNENSVLEGKRVAIDLGARKFGSVLALANVLVGEKLPNKLNLEIEKQLKWRISDSYLKSCKGEDKKGNSWIKSTSNWNAVCTSGTVFTTIASSNDFAERVYVIGSALNSMKYYISGFGDDGYCSEGVGYWNYGFSHYLYLAKILFDYTNGKVNLFEFDNHEKLKKIAGFPSNFQLNNGVYAPFADGVVHVSPDNDNFAYAMSAKNYGCQKPLKFVPDEAVQTLIYWADTTGYVNPSPKNIQLPGHSYFDKYGIVVSRGLQKKPFSISVKAGNNGENHNHDDIGSYAIAWGTDLVAGDMGGPVYIAGAFSKDNPARCSWGHSVPLVDGKIQSHGSESYGKIIYTEFNDRFDNVQINLQPAYKNVDGLKKLERTVINDKDDIGKIIITDNFYFNKPMTFGTAITTFSNYKILNNNVVIITTVDNHYKIKAEISSIGGKIEIKDEEIPVRMSKGQKPVRISIDFIKPVKSGLISIKYTPIKVSLNDL